VRDVPAPHGVGVAAREREQLRRRRRRRRQHRDRPRLHDPQLAVGAHPLDVDAVAIERALGLARELGEIRVVVAIHFAPLAVAALDQHARRLAVAGQSRVQRAALDHRAHLLLYDHRDRQILARDVAGRQVGVDGRRPRRRPHRANRVGQPVRLDVQDRVEQARGGAALSVLDGRRRPHRERAGHVHRRHFSRAIRGGRHDHPGRHRQPGFDQHREPRGLATDRVDRAVAKPNQKLA
jgi:hypothetical protein